MEIRSSFVAGQFYPADKNKLTNFIKEKLKKAKKKNFKEIKAIIVPHAGYIYSAEIAAVGFKQIENSKFKKIIFLGPSHNYSFENAVFDSRDYWKTPLGKVKIKKIIGDKFLKENNNFHNKEHCLEVEIPFLQIILKDFEIIPILTGVINPESLSGSIIKLLDEETLIIASSDLSHYYDYNTAVNIDRIALASIQNLDVSRTIEEVEACGKIPILTLMYIAKKLNWKCHLLEYKNSGDTSGNKNGVVGYASFLFEKC